MSFEVPTLMDAQILSIRYDPHFHGTSKVSLRALRSSVSLGEWLNSILVTYPVKLMVQLATHEEIGDQKVATKRAPISITSIEDGEASRL
jgi:hypothetical protein